MPEKFEGRTVYQHNPSVTLMRTTAGGDGPARPSDRGEALGGLGADALFMPLGGVSMIAVEGQPFYDGAADEALFSAIRENLASSVELIEMECDINDPAFAAGDGAEAGRLHERDRMTGDEARARLRATLEGGSPIIGAGAGPAYRRSAPRPVGPT